MKTQILGSASKTSDSVILSYVTEGARPVQDFMWAAEQIRDHVLTYKKPWVALVGQNHVLALILYIETENLIEVCYLESGLHHRRQGHMKFLLRHLLEQNPTHAFWLDVHHKNKPALELYNQFGFVQTGQRPGYYRDGGSSLQLNLKPGAGKFVSNR